MQESIRTGVFRGEVRYGDGDTACLELVGCLMQGHTPDQTGQGLLGSGKGSMHNGGEQSWGDY